MAKGKQDTQDEQTAADDPKTAEAPRPTEGDQYIWATGRRKSAVARVRIRPGKGNFLINKRQSDDYFTSQRDRDAIMSPLEATQSAKSWDIWVNVGGGGPTGQAGAVMLGLARALAKADPKTAGALKKDGLLTRDPRMSERKKYGRPGARKRFQFSKR